MCHCFSFSFFFFTSATIKDISVFWIPIALNLPYMTKIELTFLFDFQPSVNRPMSISTVGDAVNPNRKLEEMVTQNCNEFDSKCNKGLKYKFKSIVTYLNFPTLLRRRGKFGLNESAMPCFGQFHKRKLVL